MGPLISAAHKQKVVDYIKSAQAEGAELLTGGTSYIPSEHKLNKGHFLAPTIFSNCKDEMKFVKEEIFGPVAAVLTFKTESDVILRANATEYGLAGGIFTNDIRRGHRVAQALECGTVWINNYNIIDLQVPFGGYKHSGIGRECGREAIGHYTQTKSVYVEMGKVDCPYKLSATD